MNYTENLTLGLPEYGEDADVADLNRNSGILDAYCYNTRQIECEPYDSTKTYMSGDLSIHNEVVYECNTDNTTGTWDDSKWDSTTLAEQIAKAKQSGGESALADLEDVNLTNPSEGQILTYDDTNDEWVNTDMPDTAVTKEATGNPIELTDAASAPMVKCVTEIQGSQDLHGYDKPWVGGAGKNKYNATKITETADGITITKNEFGEYTVTGTATALHQFSLGTNTIKAGDYILNGCPSGGGTSTYDIRFTNNAIDNGSGATLHLDSDTSDSIYITVRNGYSFPSGGLVFKPMIRLATESDATFTPYSNICPITAYTEGEIEVRGKNLFNKNASDIAVGYYLIASTGVLSPSQSGYNTSGYIPIEPNTYYTKSGASVAADEYCFFDSEKTFISGLSRTDTTVLSPNNAAYMRFDYKASETDDIQIEKGETPTTYEPYKGSTHTTTYPSAIYRGSEDVVNGEVKSEMPVIDLGDLNWFYDYTVNSMVATVSNAKLPLSNDVAINAVCSICQIIPASQRATTTGIRLYMFISAPDIYIRDSGYTSASDFKTAIAGQKFAYELATPTTSSVTPTNLPIKSLSGYNHIESTTGDMEVEYITQGYQPIVDLIQSGNGHTYSTQEQVVGKWIDGKDLYEKTLKFTGTFYGSVTLGNIGVSNVDYLIAAELSGHTLDDTWRSLSFAHSDAQNNAGIFISSTGDVCMRAGSSVTAQYAYDIVTMTIRYTKTTTTRSLSAPVTSQKAQIEPLTTEEEEVPTEEEKAVNEEENTNENR